MNNKRRYTTQEVIDFVTDGNQSDMSEFSSDDDDDEFVPENNQETLNIPTDGSELEGSESEDEVPLSSLVNNKSAFSTAGQGTSTNNHQSNPKHHYRWRKKDTIVGNHTFERNFPAPPLEEITPLKYFKQFITDDIIDCVVEQTNIYSFQKDAKSTNTNREEIMSLIGMHMKMGIITIPSYKLYWS